MIKFYKTCKYKSCAAINDDLYELCLVHETAVIESAEHLPPELANIGGPPILVNGRDIISGNKNIITRLEELEKFKELWYKFQSDACYCDEQGDIE